MRDFFSFIEKHAISVIVVILAITVFFLINTFNIRLNGNYTAFFPYGEANRTYYGGKSGQIPDLGIDDDLVEESINKAFSSVLENNATQVKVEYGEVNPSVLKKYDFTSLTPPSNEGDAPYGGGTLLVLVEGNDLFTADSLNLIQYCINNLSSRKDVGAPYSVMDFVTLEGVGKRVGVVPMSSNSDGFWTDEEAKEFEEHVKNDPIVNYFLVGGDGKSIMFQFPLSWYNSQSEKEFEEIFAPLEEYGLNVYFNGGPVISTKVMEYLQRDLSLLMGLCIFMILITYYLSFRSKRSVLIPGSLSLIGLIWTVGTMSLMGYDITILNVVTPCMVITLGSAYSIHVLSEYYSHFKEDGTADLTPAQSAKRITSTIVLACITTVVGFLCLCVSKTEALREFGIAIGIGIAYCAVLACVYLPAILSITPPPKRKQIVHYDKGLIVKVVRFVSDFVTRYWIVLLIIFFVLTLVFFVVKDDIPIDSNYMSYFPESDKFGQESRAFAKAMGGTNPFIITITAPEGAKNYFLNHENLAKVRAYEEAILECPDLLQSISFTNYVSFANSLVGGNYGIPESNGLINMLSRLMTIVKGMGINEVSQLISDDFNTLRLTVQNWDSVEQDLMTTSSITRAYSTIVDNLSLLPEGTRVTISGDPILNVKFSNRLLNDQSISTILSIIIVLLIAIIVFRSPVKGIITIVPVLSGIMINYVFMYLTKIPFDMVTVSFSSIAIGCGVDNALHFMLRYSKKKKEGILGTAAIKSTIVETGRPIFLSTMSIVLGMLMLSFGSYMPIRYFGLLMSVTLLGCMISTLIFLPPFAMLYCKIEDAIRKGKMK